ncbi:GNAT family N-acetyltransferase [Virgibacillus sp. 179-BFC.A HS]|uniref:GNAT family N-acetyltransferase n=1 Tax=Tigheibacillus jepli TaxID=3035914 RepID=A0ABU5CGD6_9BACI|nr:GNAT family N-acetyltransferase [Virgibacillus sp. 179-BFC.A HS]MDY0405382.1 GNAT family N-acetyltransferase [Virgibacillus sp. 179-BFC.A HS]
MALTIEPYQTDDMKELVWLSKEISDNLLENTNLQAAYTAKDNQKIIGLAIAWKSTFHPFCTYFRIWADPKYENFAARQKLLHKLEQLQEKAVPLQTSLWDGNHFMQTFYERQGFRLIRKTHIHKILLTDCFISKLPKSRHEEGIKVASLDQVIENPKFKGQLLKLVKDNYEQTHLVNPVANFDLDTWQSLVLAEDVLANASFVCVHTKQQLVVAYAFMHQSKVKDTLELGWFGALESSYINWIVDIVRQQILFAIQQGYAYIETEFDSTNPHAMKVLEAMPFPDNPVWLTYQK